MSTPPGPPHRTPGNERRPVVRGRVAVVVSRSLPAGVPWAWRHDPTGSWFFVDEATADRLEADLPPGLQESQAATVARVRTLLARDDRPGPPDRPPRAAAGPQQNGRARGA